ncbi:MAG: hypothetical protein JW798_18200 [Prolixibacteraceae bacterium]|nr:hypothetical protein [Prolixibacteraceae bacterium]
MNKQFAKYLFYLCLVCFYSRIAEAKGNSLNIEANSGIGVGVWMDNSVSLGIDYSYFRLSLPFKLAVVQKHGRLGYGLEIKNSTLFVTTISSPNHGDFPYSPIRYDLAEKYGVNFTAFYATLRFDIISKERYSFTPNIAFGTFLENSVHQNKDKFGFKSAYKLELMNFIWMGKMQFIVSPVLSILHIPWSDNKTNSYIPTAGVDFGVVYSF